MKFANYSAVAESQRVDAALGVIHGVSVITAGIAQGHNLQIDSKTLDEVLSVAKTHTDGIKVKFGNDHKSGVNATIGALKNFRRDGDQIRADLHLLKSCPEYGQILEMAEKLPNEFGLSAVFSGEHVKEKEISLARCSEIYSVDLVSDPAANPNGLFSRKDDSMTLEIEELSKALKCDATEEAIKAALTKLSEKKEDDDEKVEYSADGKSHSEACMCKMCKMSKSKKKDMSELLTPETATELKRLMRDTTTELARKIEELQKSAANSAAIAQKAELDALIAEAGRNGQVIPLENEDIYSTADGIVTIHTSPDKLKKMLAKLPKAQVKLSKAAAPVTPTDADGKTFDRHTPEGKAKVIQFCRQKQAENIAAFDAEFKRSQVSLNN